MLCLRFKEVRKYCQMHFKSCCFRSLRLVAGAKQSWKDLNRHVLDFFEFEFVFNRGDILDFLPQVVQIQSGNQAYFSAKRAVRSDHWRIILYWHSVPVHPLDSLQAFEVVNEADKIIIRRFFSSVLVAIRCWWRYYRWRKEWKWGRLWRVWVSRVLYPQRACCLRL